MDADFIQTSANAFRLCATNATRTDERNYWQSWVARATIEAKAAAPVERITFLNPKPGVYVINGQRHESDLMGLVAGHTALVNRDRPDLARTLDFVLGDALRADNAVRRAIRVTAADWLDEKCWPLAAVFRAMRVTDGLVTCTNRLGGPVIKTD